jgi:hypothetical protein
MPRLTGPRILWSPGVAQPSFNGYSRVRDCLFRHVQAAGFPILNGGWDPPIDPARLIQISHAQAFNGEPHEKYWCRREGIDYAILYTTFESSKLPPGWAENCAKFDAIMTTSTYTRAVFREALLGIGRGDIPVYLVQHGVEGGEFPLMDRRARARSGAPFTFFWRGMHPLDRKQGAQVMRVFDALRLPNARLIVKGSPLGTPILSYSGVDSLMEEGGSIEFESDFWDMSEMRAALFNADCFVAPTRCEGFGLEPLEAMATGLPTMVTGWSGPLDYLLDHQEGDPYAPDYYINARPGEDRWFRVGAGGGSRKTTAIALPYRITRAFYSEEAETSRERDAGHTKNEHTPLDPAHDYGVDARVSDDDLAAAMEFAYRERAALSRYFSLMAPRIHERWSWVRAAHQFIDALDDEKVLESVAWKPEEQQGWRDFRRVLEFGQPATRLPGGYTRVERRDEPLSRGEQEPFQVVTQ